MGRTTGFLIRVKGSLGVQISCGRPVSVMQRIAGIERQFGKTERESDGC